MCMRSADNNGVCMGAPVIVSKRACGARAIVNVCKFVSVIVWHYCSVRVLNW